MARIDKRLQDLEKAIKPGDNKIFVFIVDDDDPGYYLYNGKRITEAEAEALGGPADLAIHVKYEDQTD